MIAIHCAFPLVVIVCSTKFRKAMNEQNEILKLPLEIRERKMADNPDRNSTH